MKKKQRKKKRKMMIDHIFHDDCDPSLEYDTVTQPSSQPASSDLGFEKRHSCDNAREVGQWVAALRRLRSRLGAKVIRNCRRRQQLPQLFGGKRHAGTFSGQPMAPIAARSFIFEQANSAVTKCEIDHPLPSQKQLAYFTQVVHANSPHSFPSVTMPP